MSFAVIETGGKQYGVRLGEKIRVEKLDIEIGKSVVFDRVLLKVEGKETTVGTPYIEGAKVEANVLETKKDKKKIVFRYHSKTRYRKKKGHRQQYTKVEI